MNEDKTIIETSTSKPSDICPRCKIKPSVGDMKWVWEDIETKYFPNTSVHVVVNRIRCTHCGYKEVVVTVYGADRIEKGYE